MKSKIRYFLLSNKTARFVVLFFLYVFTFIGLFFSIFSYFQNNQNQTNSNTYQISYGLEGDIKNQQKLAKTSSNFANWLAFNNVDFNNIGYDTNGFLHVNLTNVKNEDNNRFFDPSQLAIQYINNSNLTIYSFFPTANDNVVYAKDPILSSDDFVLDLVSQEPNQLKIPLKVKKDLSVLGNNFKDQFNQNQTANNQTDMQWVIFKNLDGLINSLNYAKYLSFSYDFLAKGNNPVEKQVPVEIQELWTYRYESFKKINPDLITWSDQAIRNNQIAKLYDLTLIDKNNFFQLYQIATKNDQKSTTSSNANESLKTVVDKYVINTINKTNYKQFFLQVGNEVDFKEINTLLLPNPSANLFFELTKTNLPLGFKPFAKEWLTSLETKYNDLKKNPMLVDFSATINGAIVLNPFLKINNQTGLTFSDSILLTIAIVLLLVAIIVAVFYRIPGMIASLAFGADFVFTFRLLAVFQINLSLGVVFALFLGFLLLFLLFVFWFDWIKLLWKQKNTLTDNFQLAFKKSILTMVDLTVIGIVFGLSIFFIGHKEIKDFGLTLVLVCVMNFITILLLVFLPLYLTIGLSQNWSTKYLYWKINRGWSYKIWFHPYKWFIFWFILLVLGIIGVGLFFYFLNNNQLLRSTLLIQTNQDSFNQPIILSDEVLKMVVAKLPNKTLYLSEMNTMFEPDKLASFFHKAFVLNVPNNFSLAQSTDPKISIITYQQDSVLTHNVLLTSIYALLAASGLNSFYYFVRLHFLTIIPFLFVNLLVLGLSVAFNFLFLFAYIDPFFAFPVLSNVILANLCACLYVSSMKIKWQEWHKKDEKNSFIFIIQHLKDFFWTIILVAFVGFMQTFLLAFFVSFALLLLFVAWAFFHLISTSVGFFLMAHLYYFILLIRVKYMQNFYWRLDHKLKNKIQEIDEELVFSINKF